MHTMHLAAGLAGRVIPSDSVPGAGTVAVGPAARRRLLRQLGGPASTAPFHRRPHRRRSDQTRFRNSRAGSRCESHPT